MTGDPAAMWLSEQIADAMARNGWSQGSLASLVGVSQAAVSKWLRCAGGIQVPQAIRLAQVLDHDVVDFVESVWPELAEHDPVSATLREVLGRATPAQRKRIEVAARREVDGATRVVRRRTIPEADHRELGGA